MNITSDPRLHWYPAQLNPSAHSPTGVVDGDTVNSVVDFGAYIYVHKPLRLYGINAPELSTQAGQDAKTWAIQWYQTHCPVGQFIMKSALDPEDKYGRLLATVYAADGACYNDDIVAAGHAVPYFP